MRADVFSYRVPGMHCEKCERAVRDELGPVAGVEFVEVDQPGAKVQLEIDGMTCAACAPRIERKLNRLEGVNAAVTVATETASVRNDPTRVEVAELIETIRSIGYDAALPSELQDEDATVGRLRRRLIVAAALSAPVAA
jgi:Cu+-exporting ATPase